MAAPKGNSNALKHGFYAKRLSPSENARSEQAGATDFAGEIAFLRAVVDRIAARLNQKGLGANKTEAMDEETLRAVNTLSMVMTSMCAVARTHALLSGNSSELEKSIWDALEELRTEMGI